MNRIKAYPMSVTHDGDGAYTATVYLNGEEGEHEYVAITKEDLDLLLDFKFRYESCQD